MPTLLRDLISRISAEAKLKGNDTFVGLIIHTFNEVQREYTARRRFDVLKKPFTPIAPLADGQPTFLIPADLQVLQKDSIRFSEQGPMEDAYLLNFGGAVYGSPYGYPRVIYREGSNFKVFPYTEIHALSTLFIDYWRFPINLSGYASYCEIPELEPVIIKETIGRLSRQGSSDVSLQYVKEAQRSYMASFGVDPQR